MNMRKMRIFFIFICTVLVAMLIAGPAMGTTSGVSPSTSAAAANWDSNWDSLSGGLFDSQLQFVKAILGFFLGIKAPDDADNSEERISEPAPIESVDIQVQESFPPQYIASIVAGLPNGCAEPGGHAVSREGNKIMIQVNNTMPAGDVACTMEHSTYTINADLGSDFVSGETYTVDVNGTIKTFVAE